MKRGWPVLCQAALLALALAAWPAAICAEVSPRVVTTLRGDEPDEHLGGAMAAAGDVDGDGFADLLVGDTRDGWLPGQRRCYLYHGRATLDTTPDVVIPQFEADTTEPHSDDDDLFGGIVDGGSDVNGDGFDDILITSQRWFWDTGKTYLYHGGCPLDIEPDLAVAAWGSTWMTMFWATGLRGRLIGDVNGDGCDELACVVWPYACDGGAHVYYGGAPMDSVHDLSLRGPGFPVLDLGSDLGEGDVNGDGYADVAVGVVGGQDGAWVYSGGMEMDTVPDLRLRPTTVGEYYLVCVPGDLNGDGCEDVVVSHGCYGGTPYAKAYVFFGGGLMDSLPDLELTGRNVEQAWLTTAGGDLDNDGFADLLVAEPGFYGWPAGRLAIYLGGADMDSVPDFELIGPCGLGSALAFLGDMTGDGWAEFAVSDPEGPGRIYIYTLAPEAAGDEPGALPATYSLRIVPNPTRGPVSILARGAGGSMRAHVAVYDLTGRLVRTLFAESATGVLHWDGTDEMSRPVAPGAYVIEAGTGSREGCLDCAALQASRVVVMR